MVCLRQTLAYKSFECERQFSAMTFIKAYVLAEAST